MKRLLPLLLVAAPILAGCKVTKLTTTLNGQPITFSDARLFMNSSASLDVSTNGTARFKVRSSPNAEAIEAVAEGVARGLTSGGK